MSVQQSNPFDEMSNEEFFKMMYENHYKANPFTELFGQSEVENVYNAFLKAYADRASTSLTRKEQDNYWKDYYCPITIRCIHNNRNIKMPPCKKVGSFFADE